MVKNLKYVIFKKNNKLLEIFIIENQDLFFYSNFYSKDILRIINKNILQLIKLLLKLFNIKKTILLIYFHIKNFSCYLSKV